MRDNPTKAEELAHWRQFVAALPQGSYLALYLDGSDSLLERHMASDMSCVLVSEIRKLRNEALLEAQDAKTEAATATVERDRLANAVKQLRHELARCRSELEDVCKASQTLCSAAYDSLKRAQGVK